jgi:hypothetical protein
MSSLSGAVAFPQSAKFIRRTADPLSLANIPVDRAPCAETLRSAAAPSTASGDAGSPCDTPPVRVPSVNPCNPASPAQIACHTLRDLVQNELAAMGKAGQKIQRARERVLEILQTENACSAWFREKNSNPADIFRTLSFAIDRKAEDFVLETKESDNTLIFRNPYVAKVFQGDGRYATITINSNGAFFYPVARMLEVLKGGGPVNQRGPRLTNVGPYRGDTLHARGLVLLHEFGHVLDILPRDENNAGGESVQNTGEVLRFCQAEIDSKVRCGTLAASR